MTKGIVKENLLKKIAKGLVWNQLRQFTIFPLSFLLSILLARTFGPDIYGVYSGIMAVIGLLALVSSFGFEGVSLIGLPKISAGKNSAQISFLIKRLLSIRILITLVIIIFFLANPIIFFQLVGIKAVNKIAMVKLGMLLYFVVFNVNSLLASLYKGLLKFRALYFIEAFNYSMNLLFCFLVLKFTKDLSIIFFALFTAYLLSTIFFIFGFKAILLQKQEKFELKKLSGLSFNLYITRFIHYALDKQKDLLLIGYFLQNPMLIGFYSIAGKLSDAFSNLLTMGFGEVTQPSFSETLVRNGEKGLRKIWLVFMRLEMFLTIPCLIFPIMNAKEIISIIYSDKFLPAVPIFQMFATMLLISSGILGGGTSQKVLYAMAKQNLAFFIVFLSAALNILVAILLIPKYGLLGAAFATGISIIVSVIIELLITIRLIRGTFPIKFLLKIASASLISVYVSSLFNTKDSLLLLLLNGIFYICLYVTMLYLFKPFDSEDRSGVEILNPRIEKYIKIFCKA